MDLLNRQCKSSSLISTKTVNRKRKAKNLMNIVATKKARFYSSYHRRQNWSLPDSIIYYISKNPSSSKCYQKLIRSCKYFFIQKPLLVVKRIYFGFEELLICEKPITNISSKIWITEELKIQKDFKTPPNKLSSIILPKVYRINVTILDISNQNISFNEFLFLSSNVETIYLCYTTVKSENDTTVAFEILVKALPKVKSIIARNSDSTTMFTSDTVKELLKLSHFSKIYYISLSNIPELFDFETLFTYIKKNKSTSYYFYFNRLLSKAYSNRLESIVEEIIASRGREYRVPIIYFYGLSESQFKLLRKISSEYFQKNRL